METFLIYILKASALLGIFYISYLLLLKKETSFQLNRKFLISGLLFSAVLPAIYFTKKVYIEASPSNLDFIQISTVSSETPVDTPVDWWQISGIIYLAITGFFLLRLCLRLSSVIRIIVMNKYKKAGRLNFLETSENQLPFSFFNYIVYNPEKHSKKDLKLILEHEKVHALQVHSADILLVNLMSCILWFNPFAWFYKKSVEQNLEFIADRETVNNKAEIKEYQHALVKVSIADLRPALTNHFYQSFTRLSLAGREFIFGKPYGQVKKRILMLNKKSSTHSPAWKLSLVMPLLLAFMLLFNVKTEAQVVEQEKTKTTEKTEAPEPEEEMEVEEEVEIEEEIEMIEPAEASEVIEVEVEEAPEVTWTALRTRRGNGISNLGYHPLYVINGKKFKASKLNNKYIGLNSGIEILTGDDALNRYGDDAESGVVIIPDAEIIRNFNKEMKDLKSQKNFKGRYIMVGENGKPNFINLNSGKTPAPSGGIYAIRGTSGSGNISYGGSDHDVKVLSYSSSPKPENTYVIRSTGKAKSTSANAESFISSGDMPGINSEKSRVKIISHDGEPLYIIDGEEQTGDFDPDSINAENIASMMVLKGEGAIAKYGEKAKNGVIEIQTRSNLKTASQDKKLVKIHARMSDAELEKTKSKLKELTGIVLKIDNISRNDGLITSIRLNSTLDGKQISNGHFEDTNSIPNIYVGLVNDKPIVRSSRD